MFSGVNAEAECVLFSRYYGLRILVVVCRKLLSIAEYPAQPFTCVGVL